MSKPDATHQLELWGVEAPQYQDGDGSQDTFSLIGETAPPSSSSKRVPTPANTSGKLLDTTFAMRRPLQILIADDNAINRKIIRIILKKLGYDCSEASDGIKALDAYRSGNFDYIFMDLDMPEMDGIEAARQIRTLEEETAVQRAIPEIIAVTANVSDETRRKCKKAGMNGYLEKPITATVIKDQLIRSWPRIRSRKAS